MVEKREWKLYNKRTFTSKMTTNCLTLLFGAQIHSKACISDRHALTRDRERVEKVVESNDGKNQRHRYHNVLDYKCAVSYALLYMYTSIIHASKQSGNTHNEDAFYFLFIVCQKLFGSKLELHKIIFRWVAMVHLHWFKSCEPMRQTTEWSRKKKQQILLLVTIYYNLYEWKMILTETTPPLHLWFRLKCKKVTRHTRYFGAEQVKKKPNATEESQTEILKFWFTIFI